MMAAAAFSKKFSPSEVLMYLKEYAPTLSEDVLEVIVSQKIDGEVFMALDGESLREIAPLVGDRVKIKSALNHAKAAKTAQATKQPVVS